MSDVKKIVDNNCMQKYKRFKKDTMVARDKNLIFCSKPDCDSILNKKLNHDKKRHNKLICPDCGQKTCYLCKQQYEPEKLHDNKKCLDSTNMLNEAIDGGIIFHKCPQCHCQLEKNGGCSMM